MGLTLKKINICDDCGMKSELSDEQAALGVEYQTDWVVVHVDYGVSEGETMKHFSSHYLLCPDCSAKTHDTNMAVVSAFAVLSEAKTYKEKKSNE